MKRLERALVSAAAAACVALGLGACAGGTDENEAMEEPPPCSKGRPAVLEGLSLERPAAYVGDYENGILLASIGTPCNGAPHPDRCSIAFELAQQSNPEVRALITTDGDNVRLWSRESLLVLLGDIDTSADAIYFATSIGYAFDCEVTVTRLDNGFRLFAFGVGFSCGTGSARGQITVGTDGSVIDPAAGGAVDSGSCGRADRPTRL